MLVIIVVRFTSAVPAPGKLKQEKCNEFQASLGPEGGGRRKEDCLAIQGNNDYKCKFSPCVLFVYCWDRFWLCTFGLPETCYVDQIGHELRDLLVSAFFLSVGTKTVYHYIQKGMCWGHHGQLIGKTLSRGLQLNGRIEHLPSMWGPRFNSPLP